MPEDVKQSGHDVPAWTGPLQVLSLDGGGIRGLFAAAVLAQLEEDLEIDVTDHFDLIVGTSTGGIIALALGHGLRPAALVDFYLNLGKRIFSGPHWLRWLRWWFHAKYSGDRLEEALRGVLGDALIGASKKRVVVPAYDLGRDDIRLFKTAHHPRFKHDWRIPAWKVAMATSAAPTFFPAWRGIDRRRLIDGGVWANNPTILGIVEATSVLGADIRDVRVLSLGTCFDKGKRTSFLNRGGLLPWGKNAAEVLMNGQSIGTNNLAKLLLKKENLVRVDPVVPKGVLALDRAASADALIAEASHAGLHLTEDFGRVFQAHRASEFRPFHGGKEQV